MAINNLVCSFIMARYYQRQNGGVNRIRSTTCFPAWCSHNISKGIWEPETLLDWGDWAWLASKKGGPPVGKKCLLCLLGPIKLAIRGPDSIEVVHSCNVGLLKEWHLLEMLTSWPLMPTGSSLCKLVGAV